MIYEDPSLYERQALPKEYYTPILDEIIHRYRVEVALDLGCGLGVDTAMMYAAGLEVHGIDGSEAMRAHVLFPRERYLVRDLTEPLDMPVDLIWCREVAEHIPEEHSETLVDNITRNGAVAYFTAARPGQIGHQHVNCQPRSYWLEKFHRRHWIQDSELSGMLANHPNQDDYLNGMVLYRL